MSSVLQLLLWIPSVDNRRVADGVASTMFCSAPADAEGDWMTSFATVASALTDVRAIPRPPTLTGESRRPEALVALGHLEFSTGCPKDASNLLRYRQVATRREGTRQRIPAVALYSGTCSRQGHPCISCVLLWTGHTPASLAWLR